MSNTPFFKCYPSDFLNGVSEMTPNQLAVYTTIIMRMYDEDGPIANRPDKLARRCNMRLPACKKAINELVEDGKLLIDGGMIVQKRTSKELQKRRETRSKQSGNAQARWNEGAEKSNENNGTTTKRHSQTDTNEMPTRSQSLEVIKKKKGLDPTGPKNPKSKGTRIADDWVLPDDWIDWALGEGLATEVIKTEAAQFHDYWLGKAGKDATKANWKATWRSWIRNHKKFNGTKTNGKSTDTSTKQLGGLYAAMVKAGKSDGAGVP